MADQAPDERRNEYRKSKTLFCQILCASKRYPAAVLDISPSGLFVRTAASPPPGTEVEVSLRLAGSSTWTLKAAIARAPITSAGQNSVAGRGLGLRILEAPDGFAEFVATL